MNLAYDRSFWPVKIFFLLIEQFMLTSIINPCHTIFEEVDKDCSTSIGMGKQGKRNPGESTHLKIKKV